MKGVDFISSFLYFKAMNKVIYIVLIAILYSCKSNSIAQEKVKTSSDTPKIEKPKFGDPGDNKLTKLKPMDQSQISPNTVHLTGTVLGVYKNKSICGKPYDTAITIRVKDIIGAGSGIVNMISSQQEITFGLKKGQLEDFNILRKKHSENQEITFVVTEGLCRDMNKTAYEVIRFNVKS